MGYGYDWLNYQSLKSGQSVFSAFRRQATLSEFFRPSALAEQWKLDKDC